MNICLLFRMPIFNPWLVVLKMKAGIVGAGILGRLLAFAFLQAKWQVTLFDFKQGENCSEAAAGLLAPVTELEKNELLIFKLGTEALDQHWPKIIAYFKEKVFFQKKGMLVLAHPRDQADLLHYIRLITSKLGEHSFCQKIDQQEISQLEPQLAQFQQAYFFPSEGQIDSQGFLNVLLSDLLRQGVRYRNNNPVEKMQPGQVRLKNKSYCFDLVLDCRGLGAKTVFKDLRGVRGELIWLKAPQIHLSRPIRLLHPRYSLYLAPRPQGHYLLGASEIEATDYSPLSVRSALELLTAVYSIHSNFGEARLIKSVTQCRPTLPNHLPAIRYSDGLIAVNGLYRHGFLIAPTLVAEIQRWLEAGISNVRYPVLWEKAA